jgi:glycosyltransferase involved in cell wall biosynthesis
MVKLSILIPLTESRRQIFMSLHTEIQRQLCEGVELILDWHETDNVGKKRNRLLEMANGEYVVFVDSDDEISPNYIERILEACKSGVDCIGINGIITIDGGVLQKWFISKEYGAWYQRGDVFYRTPNHISPVRRELALQAGFPEVTFGEDAEYSRRLLPLLKTEIIINEPLYHYKYVSDK